MHVNESATRAPALTTRPRTWSYEALRQADIYTSIDASRIGGVYVPWMSPRYGPGCLGIHGPSDTDLGRWLLGIAASFSSYFDRHPPERRRIERVRTSFIRLDHAREVALSGDPIVPDSARGRRVGRAARMYASEVLRCESCILREFARVGLLRRVGERLVGIEENVWIHLVARKAEPAGLRVCEQCAVVFSGSRARRCSRCQKRPLRITLHPVREGGWHLDYRVGARFAAADFDRTVHYQTRCTACDRVFETSAARQRLCANCGGTSGRVRRHRGSASQTGRQRFRFKHVDGASDFSVGIAQGPDGHALQLTAIDGVIETADAEVSRLLDANFCLRPAP